MQVEIFLALFVVVVLAKVILPPVGRVLLLRQMRSEKRTLEAAGLRPEVVEGQLYTKFGRSAEAVIDQSE